MVYINGIKLIPLFLLITSASHAADFNIRVNGRLVANSCTVSVASANRVVALGKLAIKQFQADGHIPVPFTIDLQYCIDAVSGVKVTFNGAPDPQDSSVLALNASSTAAYVGLVILDQNRKRVPLGTASQPYRISSDKVSMAFYAQYVPTGKPVMPGSANADATFTLEYQ